MTDFTKAELRWLDRPDTDRPRGYQAVIGQLSRTVRDYRTYTGQIADALLRASVSEPPQQRRPQTGKISTSEISDPALGSIVAVAEAVSRAALRYAHLLAPCGMDGCDHAPVDLAGLLAELGAPTGELEATSDSLSATMASQTGAMRSDLRQARLLHLEGATRLDGLVKGLDDPSHVSDVVGRMSWLTVQAGRLRGSVAQWIAGPLVRTCECGCGSPANHGAKNDACRKRRERAS